MPAGRVGIGVASGVRVGALVGEAGRLVGEGSAVAVAWVASEQAARNNIFAKISAKVCLVIPLNRIVISQLRNVLWWCRAN